MNLEDFVREFGQIVKSGEIAQIMGNGAALISNLSSNHEFVDDCLARILLDDYFMSRQKESVWPNEITVFRDPDRIFSVLMYIWETGIADIIHDHNSWGLVCVARGEIEETKYRRVDDGSRPHYAELEPVGTRRIRPAGITSVLPLNKGIHQMRGVDSGPTITFNAYGIPEKRGHILFFDPERKSCREAYPPGTFKKVLAARALLARPEKAEEVLQKALEMQLPRAVLEEARKTLSLVKAREARPGLKKF